MTTTWGEHDVWVTRHALERLELHYPGVSIISARGILSRSLEVDEPTIRPVLGRVVPAKPGSRFFLPPERRGVLIVEPENRARPANMPWVLVTYIRLEASQQRLVDRLWPREAVLLGPGFRPRLVRYRSARDGRLIRPSRSILEVCR